MAQITAQLEDSLLENVGERNIEQASILQDEIIKTAEWWNDKAFVKQMDNDYEAWEKGKEKAFTLEETDAVIAQLKEERKRCGKQAY